MRILSKTGEIQREVRRLMKPGTRRVALTAFVGAGASAYIPKPEGVTIVCWPKAGGTNPRAIRELIKNGADVRFADRLHMKLFWAQGRGALVGSANLSTNALGSGQLKELVVSLPASAISVDRLLQSCGSRKVREKELKKLDREHRKLGQFVTGGESPAADYSSWFNSPHRPDWKLGWWNEKTDFSVAAQKKAKAEHNKDPQGAICGRKGDYRYPDWILSFGLAAKQAKEPKWIFVNFVIRHSTLKNEKYPFEAVQVDSNRERPPPPFSLGRGFSKALNAACRQFGIENLKDLRGVQPPKKLLHLLRDAMSRPTQK